MKSPFSSISGSGLKISEVGLGLRPDISGFGLGPENFRTQSRAEPGTRQTLSMCVFKGK